MTNWFAHGFTTFRKFGKQTRNTTRDVLTSVRICFLEAENNTKLIEVGLFCNEIFIKQYRDGLKSGPVWLSNSQAEQGREFKQPRKHFLSQFFMI